MILSEHAIFHLVERFGPGVVGGVAALEATGLPVPAESLLIATAAYAGSTGHLSIALVVGAAAAGAILGDNLGYLIGRSLGYAVLHRWGKYVGLSEDRLLLGRYLFRRHGGKVVFFGRFVALLRTLAALLAGANRMPWPHFLFANAAGGILWACAYGFGAYALGNEVRRISGPAAIVLGAAATIAVVTGVLYLRKHEAQLTEQARRALADR
ncbi:MAG: DedA family protein [Rhodospirillales bacterium]|nr:DedA family protein [Rhodospirillales bacterium]